MCGIIGYLGAHEASPIILDALRKLEYRGYDSAGIATIFKGRLDRRRTSGRIDNLADTLVRNPIRGTIGIGHTRWATHGPPNEQNAHPHHTSNVSVVHNGIIENFKDIKDSLQADRYAFYSETDTEAISTLVQKYIDDGCKEIEAVHRSLAILQGQYALCFLFAGHDDTIIAARKGSPLVIGHGSDAMYIASDAYGLNGLTDTITYLEEGDSAIVARSGVSIFDCHQKLVQRDKNIVSIETGHHLKGQYKHFMLREIHEQPEALSKAVGSLFQSEQLNAQTIDSISHQDIGRINLIGCGTAAYACQIGSYWFEHLVQIASRAEVASEFRYRNAVVEKNDLSIFVSQSGETADTLAALRYIIKHQASNLAVLNASACSMERESARSLSIHAGYEFSVASTKAFTSQLAILAGLGLILGHRKGTVSDKRFNTLKADLLAMPGLVSTALGLKDDVIKIAQFLAGCSAAIYIGRGVMYPTALEGALKLKEITYIHAEGMASGELKHGPIALIDEKVPTIVLAPRNDLFHKTISNLKEIRARGGPVILISDREGISEAGEEAAFTLTLPKINPLLAPILYAIPLQMLAYYASTKKGLDVDKPRHLAKSVTVE